MKIRAPSLLDRILDQPSYGYTREGKLYIPSSKEIFKEFFQRLNVFSSKKNWLPFFSWCSTLILAVPLIVYFTHFFKFTFTLFGFIYGMVFMGSHGTFWLHRYCTHRAYKFKNKWVRSLCRNLVIRLIPEEIYVISHHVHHGMTEQPGDPYNVHCGWLYCFLADVNHQTISKNLSERDYSRVAQMLNQTGVYQNSYAQYLKWGSVSNPLYSVGHYLLNWSFWYAVFYWMGGHALATCFFGFAGVWGVGVRTFNFDGHGSGKDRRCDGVDHNREDLSVNQWWPGLVAGEWHNNHHLYPNGARSGFQKYQLDLPWQLIRFLAAIGWVHSVRDFKSDFTELTARAACLPQKGKEKKLEVKRENECPSVVMPPQSLKDIQISQDTL